MTIDLAPGPATTASLVAGASLLAWLVLLSHGPWRVTSAGSRFVAAALFACAVWVALLMRCDVQGAGDLLAGAMILGMALLAGFTFWTLVAWGFTLSMLLTLARHDRGLTLGEWISAYTGGRTIEAFGGDRLGVLFRLGLAEKPADQVIATARGRQLARCTALVRKLFGIAS